MQAKIGNSLIHRLTPEAKPYEVNDTELKGFLLRVQPSGSLAFYCSYRNQQGKRNRVSLGRHPTISPAQARAHARQVLASVVKGEDPATTARPKKVHTFETYLDKEYGPWVKSNRKTGEATLDRIKASFPKLLSLSLAEISPQQIDKWRTNSARDGKKPATINRDISTVKSALAKAVEWGLLGEHPLQSVKPIRLDSAKIVRYLSRTEELALRNALDARENRLRTARENANKWRAERSYPLLPDLANQIFADHLKPMVLISINTGLRQGELFHLAWDSVDLERAQLVVHGGTAKSGNTRHIPLNAPALSAFESWKHQQTITDGLVFPSTDGNAFDNVNRSWHGVLTEAKISSFRWHDMRHHFASKLVMAGVDVNTVRELLGHSDLTMTLRYAHLAPEHKAAAVAKLDRI
ncbi:MAG: tyrosine-type recombinase/integrase [Thiobacillus sp.]